MKTFASKRFGMAMTGAAYGVLLLSVAAMIVQTVPAVIA